MDEKSVALIHLQRVTMEHNAASPVKNNELEQALGAWGGGNGRPKSRGGVGAHGRGGGRGGRGGGGGGAAAVPPQLLVTTKQYRPYRKTQTVFSSGAAADATPSYVGPGVVAVWYRHG